MRFRKYVLSALMLAAMSTGFAQQAAQKSSQTVNAKALVKSLDKALNDYYVLPDQARLIGDRIESQLRKGAYKGITNPQVLAEKIAGDVQAAHRDGHLRVYYEPDTEMRVRAREKDPEGMKPASSPEAARRAQAGNFAFKKVEVLDGNIGYVQFNQFVGGAIESAKPIVTAAFRFVANTEAVIIDLRTNGGGSPEMAQLVASYFYPERTRLNDIYERVSNKTTQMWADPAAAEDMKLAMPLYILTSKRTFSAAEDFTYAMQANKRAIVVGETTGGGAHPTRFVALGQGFIASIPFARSINPITGTDWEGTGITPDVRAPAAEALVKAQAVILEKRMATADPEERAQIQWDIAALGAQDYANKVDPVALRSLAGNYGKYQIAVSSGQLVMGDASGRVMALRPLSAESFLMEDWLRLQFARNPEGKLVLKFDARPGAEAKLRRSIGAQDSYARVD